jgi:hypothetical protein
MRRALFLLTFVLAQVAHAQSEDTEAAKAAAGVHYAAGEKAMERGDEEAAYQEFMAAAAIYRSRATVANIGLSAIATARYLEGARHLQEYIKTGTDTPDYVLAEYRKALTYVARVRFESVDVGVHISLDGKLIHVSPAFQFEWIEMPGDHKLRATKTGAAPIEKTLTLPRGVVVIEKLRFDNNVKPINPATTAGGSQPANTPTSSAGNERAGTDQHSFPTKLVTVGALGTVALGTGVAALIFALNGSAANDRLAAERKRQGTSPLACEATNGCRALEQAADDRNSANQKANVLFAVSVTFAVLTGGTYLLWPEPKKHSATIVPWLDPKTGGGASWNASF